MGNRSKKLLDEETSSEKLQGTIAVVFIILLLGWITYYFYYDSPDFISSNEVIGTVTKIGMETSSQYNLPSFVARVTINGTENIMATNPRNLPVKKKMVVILDIYKTQHSNKNHYKIREILNQ